MSSPRHGFDHPMFPDALIASLFEHVGGIPCLAMCARVCRRWNRIIEASPSTLSHIRLLVTRDEQVNGVLKRLLPQGRMVRTRTLHLAIPDRARLLEMQVSEQDTDMLVREAPRITHLTLNCVRIGHPAIAKLSQLRHLTALSLDFTPNSSAGLTAASVQLDQHYFNAICQLRNLTYLRLHCTWNTRSSFLAKLADLHELRQLELSFKSGDISSETCAAWADGLTQLRVLKLHKLSARIEETTVFEPLSRLTHLEQLEFPHCVSSFADFASLTQLRSLTLLIASNAARGTDSDVRPLANFDQLTHLRCANQEGHADTLLEAIKTHAPTTLTSLHLTLDNSLTEAGCATLYAMQGIRYLTLLNANLVLTDEDEGEAEDAGGVTASAAARFFHPLRYLHVSRLSFSLPHNAGAPIPRRNPFEFIAAHCPELEVLRVDEMSEWNLLPLRRCPKLIVIGDASPTLFGRGNFVGTRSNLIRHPSLHAELRDWLARSRYLLMRPSWHTTISTQTKDAPHNHALPAFLPADKEEFFERLERQHHDVEEATLNGAAAVASRMQTQPLPFSNEYSRGWEGV